MATETARAILYRPEYFGSLHIDRNVSHICICGIVDYELLHRFCNEAFKAFKDRERLTERLVVVVLSPTRPSDNVILLMQAPIYRKKVLFYIGSCKSFIDLKRVVAHKAKIIYVIADIATTSVKVEEDSIYLSAISVSKYLKTQKPSKRASRTIVKLTSSGKQY